MISMRDRPSDTHKDSAPAISTGNVSSSSASATSDVMPV